MSKEFTYKTIDIKNDEPVLKDIPGMSTIEDLMKNVDALSKAVEVLTPLIRPFISDAPKFLMEEMEKSGMPKEVPKDVLNDVILAAMSKCAMELLAESARKKMQSDDKE